MTPSDFLVSTGIKSWFPRSFIAGAMVVLAFFTAGCGGSAAKLSVECVKIEKDLRGSLKAGDSEEDAVQFFKKRGWKYGGAAVNGSYDFELGQGKIHGEDHLVLVHVEVRSGFVVGIEVKDFYRTL